MNPAVLTFFCQEYFEGMLETGRSEENKGKGRAAKEPVPRVVLRKRLQYLNLFACGSFYDSRVHSDGIAAEGHGS